MTGPAAGPGSGAANLASPATEQQLDAATAYDTRNHSKSAAHDPHKPTKGVHIKGMTSHDAAAGSMEMAAAAVSTAISSSSIGTDSSELHSKGHHHAALLAPIPLERQLNLRWERICAYVSTDYDEPGVLTKTLQRCRGQEVAKHEKKQVSCLVPQFACGHA